MNNNDFLIESGILKRYMGTDAHVVIPNAVKALGDYAFYRATKVVSVELPESVSKIGSYAFQDCTSLERVAVRGKVEAVGAAAFRNCKNLRSIAFVSEPEKIGLLAFYGCWKLEDSSAPAKEFLERMRAGIFTADEGKMLYESSKSKGAVTVKGFSNVSMLGWDGNKYPYVFSNNEEFLIIPVSIGGVPVAKAPSKQIPENAAVYCGAEQFDKLARSNKAILSALWLAESRMLREELTEKIPAFIKKYADDVARALEGCEDPGVYRRFVETAKPKAAVLDKLVEQCRGRAEILAVLLSAKAPAQKPEDSLSLDAKPKMTATELKKLWTYQTYMDGKTEEKYLVLSNYKGHDKHVDIPEYIGKTRVGGVRCIFPAEVESVAFPSENMEIQCSFAKCRAMADPKGFITVSVGGRRVVTDYIGPKDVQTLTIPEGVTENTYGSFRELNMQAVVIPEGFEKLASSSFMDCKKLCSVSLPESLREIGHMAFQDCNILKKLHIPAGVETIGALDLRRREDLTLCGKPGSQAQVIAGKYGYTFLEE